MPKLPNFLDNALLSRLTNFMTCQYLFHFKKFSVLCIFSMLFLGFLIKVFNFPLFICMWPERGLVFGVFFVVFFLRFTSQQITNPGDGHGWIGGTYWTQSSATLVPAISTLLCSLYLGTRFNNTLVQQLAPFSLKRKNSFLWGWRRNSQDINHQCKTIIRTNLFSRKKKKIKSTKCLTPGN